MASKISLVMTVYNRQRFVAAAIESALGQTYSDFELLVWDDGSTDQSLEIAQTYSQADPRVKVFAGHHQGRTRSLQAAHAATQGTYVGWLDSDDLLAPTALERTAHELDTHPDVGMVYTNYQVIDENGTVTGPGSRCQIPFSKDQLLLDFMTFHFRLIRHSAFVQAGGIDSDFPAAIDYDLCLRLSEVTQIKHLEQSLYFYRSHPQSMSGLDQLQQVYFSREAISRALNRRGLADKFQIEVQVKSQFFLRKRLPTTERKSK